MTSIVPYAGGAIQIARRSAFLRTRNARRAYALGKFAYEHRGDIRRAAIRIRKRAAKRLKTKMQRGLGPGPSTPMTANVAPQIYSPGTEGDKVLWYKDITFPKMETTNQSYSQRTGPTIDFRGLKLCVKFQNNEGTDGRNVHFALVQMKPVDFDVSTLNTTAEVFTDPYSKTDRSRPFQAGAWSSAYDHTLHCLNLNPKLFNIIFHKKFYLEAKNIAYTNGRRYYKSHMKYHKINRKITFDAPANIHPERKWLLLVWCQRADMGATNSDTNKTLFIEMNTRVYYRNLASK